MFSAIVAVRHLGSAWALAHLRGFVPAVIRELRLVGGHGFPGRYQLYQGRQPLQGP